MQEKMKTLAQGLRSAADNLRSGAYYAWGHHGACNCGHLLQVITQRSKEEILTYAHTGTGEWTELADESCSVTGAPVDLLLKKLTDLGLTPTDIHHLEYLEDRNVLNRLPGGFRWLKRNVREDVIIYFETLAEITEEKIAQMNTPARRAGVLAGKSLHALNSESVEVRTVDMGQITIPQNLPVADQKLPDRREMPVRKTALTLTPA